MVTENHLQELFKALEPQKAHKDKLFQDLAAKIDSHASRQRRPMLWRQARSVMTAALIIVCMAATTAYAAAYMGLDWKLLRFLNPANSEQEIYLENGAYVVDETAANENGTLEVKQILGDSNLIYILMDFTAPEGTVLNADRYRFHSHLDRPGSNSAGYGYTLLDDEDANDNKISLVLTYLSDNIIPGSPVTLQVNDLEAADAFPDNFETVIPGSWETKFDMNYKDLSTTRLVQQKLSLYGYEATLSSISISPISVTLKVSSEHAKEISEASSRAMKEVGPNEYLDNYPITINYQDGTSEKTTMFTGLSSGDLIKNEITIIKTFTPIIKNKEIETIAFFDAVIPVD